MYKTSVLSGAEKLTEVKGFFFVAIFAHQAPEVVCINMDSRQVGVWVGIAKMIDFPIYFGVLLHDVVPSEDFFLFVVVQQIERRPR
ncbi:hypothetical protein IX335_001424 [Porphyromonas levii]|nr:hypothetical protein [Porphyromonas levii]